MSPRVPTLLAGLIDDAAALQRGTVPVRQAVAGHRAHRQAWYADLVGPLSLPASELGPQPPTGDGAEPLVIGLIGDTGPAPAGLPALCSALERVKGWARVTQIEAPVAMRGDDPLPGLRALIELDEKLAGDCPVFAEIPLTWGLVASLDLIAQARAAGSTVAPKFRTGGLAAELFPTPVELAAVICACRDRDLPFKLTAGLNRAIRRTDPDTGLINHGFLNVLVATLAAADGGEPADLAEVLGAIDPLPVVESARAHLATDRPLWVGFGAPKLDDPVLDLRTLGLLVPEEG